jgi:hypothetical protein
MHMIFSKLAFFSSAAVAIISFDTVNGGVDHV